MKKKLMMVLSGAILAMSLCACGKEETTTAPTTAQVTESVTDFDTQETEDSFQADRGTVDSSNVYTNSAFDLSFKIDDNCTIYTDEQIMQLLGIGQDVIQESFGYTAEQLEKAMNGTFYDVWFAYPDGASSVYVAYENMDTMGISSATEDMFVVSMKQQFEAVTSLGYTFDDDTKESYGGYEYTCINAHTNANIDQKFLLRKNKNYMICIAISFPAGTSEIPNSFLNSITNAK